jgi:membrane protease subunit HflK
MTGHATKALRPRAWHVAVAILVAIGVHWYVTGVRVIQQDEQGVVLRFGKVNRVLPAGFHMTLPWPFETTERVVTTEVRTMPVGFKYEDAQSGIPPSDEELQWLTGDTNIVEMRLVIQYVVRDPVQYLFRVAHLPDGKPRDRVLRKVAETALTELLARMEIDTVLSVGKARIQNDSRSAIQEMIDALGLGVSVLSVNLAEVSPPRSVISSFNDVSIAKQDKGNMLNEADGYRRDLLPKERARANDILQRALVYQSEVVNRAKGAARKFLALAEEVRLAPEVSRKRLWLDAVNEVFPRTEIKVYPSRPGTKFILTIVE